MGALETGDGPCQRCILERKSKLIAEEEIMSCFNLAMGKVCESQSITN